MTPEDLAKQVELIDWLSAASPIERVLGSTYFWDWLPTSRDQEDPLNGPKKCAETKAAEMLVYRAVLMSLRKIGRSHPSLVYGPHDFTESSRGGALFAFKMAAREAVLRQKGVWSEVADLYSNGRWPCGLKENRELVVL
ncbi:hypothetical protein [Marinobacter sp. EVN1]|uniref:hypothetical protein n=1 Tax=Marinobacter sp. EVN1 TaxID=1397532 RepID=UPI0012696D97|nr:hypothetical protein [Marinobacter sp. EVN1]